MATGHPLTSVDLMLRSEGSMQNNDRLISKGRAALGNLRKCSKAHVASGYYAILQAVHRVGGETQNVIGVSERGTKKRYHRALVRDLNRRYDEADNDLRVHTSANPAATISTITPAFLTSLEEDFDQLLSDNVFRTKHPKFNKNDLRMLRMKVAMRAFEI